MAERTYTVKEVDELRRACEMRWLWGTTRMTHSRFSQPYRAEDKAAGTELLVRTAMLAGHTAQDFYDADGAER